MTALRSLSTEAIGSTHASTPVAAWSCNVAGFGMPVPLPTAYPATGSGCARHGASRPTSTILADPGSPLGVELLDIRILGPQSGMRLMGAWTAKVVGGVGGRVTKSIQAGTVMLALCLGGPVGSRWRSPRSGSKGFSISVRQTRRQRALSSLMRFAVHGRMPSRNCGIRLTKREGLSGRRTPGFG